jgi:hypothetical protein
LRVMSGPFSFIGRIAESFSTLLQSTVRSVHVPAHAGVAQLVERLIRNQQVRGSSPRAGSISQV